MEVALSLRISHIGSEVVSTFEGQTERRPFSFTLSAQEAEDIRWYLEDYGIYPVDPQPKIAKQIEQRMADVGRELFRIVLDGSDVWESVRHNLGATRIEVETEVVDASVPWELMRDPVADLPLALAVQSFVRCHSRPALRPIPLGQAAGKIRILLAICRPAGANDVAFRSVALHLTRGLRGAASQPFDLEVLRPPTFEQLAKRLREAKMQGQPFHAIHFDGHGLSGEVFFENPKVKKNSQSVKPAELGKLLHETGVPLLILNACRSADNEPPDQPEKVGDVHEQIRQFGSFAHAVMDSGLSGVVAWRYSVFADTAAQYMAYLYRALAAGSPLGESATLARKQLSSGNREFEDWTVPIVFEAGSVQLFPKAGETLRIKLETRAEPESRLPHSPDIGFIGRDETILKLDRTFDEQSIVLVHAYAGSGKTSTAAEFARWYGQTGGVSGPHLFTSFEQHKTLPRVMDELGRVFKDVLARNNIQWLALDDGHRREVALQILRQVPVLWIWDNVEPIAGFPAGTPSAWSEAERKELLDFLQAARVTKAKFVLTSRRDEQDWLHDLPARIELPPMPFDERVRLTEELAKKRGRRLDDVEDWRPLLRFSQGNPMTLTVLTGQALRDGLKSRDQIADFVRNLQAGDSVFEDDASEGRTRSLAASLAYGFENAFTEAERKQLALLHLFQGFVQVAALQYMGISDAEWCLPEVKDLRCEVASALLDRAVEVGLLTTLNRGYYYGIHPALPWFFRRLFEQYYSKKCITATQAFAEAMGQFAAHCHGQYEDGNREVIRALTAGEASLLRALGLARSNGWRRPVIGTMQGLRQLYGHTGRRSEWSRLVGEIIPEFVDPATDGPRPGREEEWSIVGQYRVRLAQEARRWEEAERLQDVLVDWHRQCAGTILEKPPQAWTDVEKNSLRSLGASLQDRAHIHRDRGSGACVEGYKESLSLVEQIGDAQAAAACAFNLGRAHTDLADIQDLDIAEQWYRRSIGLRAKEDRLGQARCLGQLGSVHFGRFREAISADRPREECLSYLSKAEDCYKQALEMFPRNAVGEFGIIHSLLGNLYARALQINTALPHYHQSVLYYEAGQDRFGTGSTRFNAAVALVAAGRLAYAHDWAQSARRDFEACENAEQEVVKTLKLLEDIESARRATSQLS